MLSCFWFLGKIFHAKKRSSRGRYLRRRAQTSITILYQMKLKMSIISPVFVTYNIFFIRLRDFICAFRKLHILSSRTFFSLYESIMIFCDCFNALFIVCSRELIEADFGDFISYSIPSILISAVWIWLSGRNSTKCPIFAKTFAIRLSCGQGSLPGAINTPALDIFILVFFISRIVSLTHKKVHTIITLLVFGQDFLAS